VNILLNNAAVGFVPPAMDVADLRSLSNTIFDQSYLNYTSVANGGFYFDRSLHLYGFCKGPSFHSILEVNEVFKTEFGIIAEGKFVFGQDVFSNQFAFAEKGIFFVNVETGDSDFLARDFNDWLELLSEDTEFLTGVKFLKGWESSHPRLQSDQRLCPKKPFVIGGEYSVENLYAQSFPKYMASNANIARQIYGKPDGTRVVFGSVD
jgi:hypothetical protein